MPQSKEIKILLVDDQADNILVLESILDGGGYDLVAARSGAQALRCLLERDFALVLLDVRMPEMDGYETAALIRKRELSKHTPIIFVTAGQADEEEFERAYALGAVDFISKPIVSSTLKAKVQVFAELHRKTLNLAASEEALRLELAERAKTQEALKESEEKYRELFSRASDAIVLFHGLDRRVLDANKAALQLYGYAREDFLKLGAADLAAEPSLDQTPALGASPPALPDGPVFQVQRRISGHIFPAEITFDILAYGGQQTVRALTRDISERRQAEEARHLREREEIYKRFVATVSHELRTPISAIKASAESLRLGGNADRASRPQYLRIIESQADRLAALVEDLLALSEFEAGKARPEPRRIALSEFVPQFAAAMAPLAARKGVKLKIIIDEPAEAWVDHSHLSRILQNLIDNAIKYNKKGGSVSVVCRALGSREAQVSVRDTGIGIRPEDLPRIFQPFYRTLKARAAAVKGTGLGLNIIKSLVESNGGRIWVENLPDHGSAFHFTLPLAEDRAGA